MKITCENSTQAWGPHSEEPMDAKYCCSCGRSGCSKINRCPDFVEGDPKTGKPVKRK